MLCCVVCFQFIPLSSQAVRIKAEFEKSLNSLSLPFFDDPALNSCSNNNNNNNNSKIASVKSCYRSFVCLFPPQAVRIKAEFEKSLNSLSLPFSDDTLNSCSNNNNNNNNNNNKIASVKSCYRSFVCLFPPQIQELLSKSTTLSASIPPH